MGKLFQPANAEICARLICKYTQAPTLSFESLHLKGFAKESIQDCHRNNGREMRPKF